jgi:transcriptional regulator with XRE-family HTH domain
LGRSSGHWLTADGETPTARAAAFTVPPSNINASDFFMAETLAHFHSAFSTLTSGRGLIMLNMSTLEERIAELMKSKDWTESRVAEIAGVTRSAVSQWLGKTDTPTKSIKLKPALLLERKSGFSALWLSAGEGPKMVITQSELSTRAALLYLASTLAELPKIKRDGVAVYIGHLIKDCEDENAVLDAIEMIESAIETKRVAA